MSGRIMFATMKTQPGKRAALVEAFAQMFESAAGEDGTLAYVLVEADDDPDTLYMWEHYTDQAAMDTHMASDALAALHGALGEYLADGGAVTGTIVRSI
ncbi:MAG: antibiotic biosynthesis monooxygenase [Acidimicrobiales bacterium]|nr:antibiotic biosynthesis monooxygenase [Acidimicrobiales bacterium]